MLTASPTSSSDSVAATIPRAVSSTQVKSRVCEPVSEDHGRQRRQGSASANLGITSALVPSACERGPYELNGRITVTGRPYARMQDLRVELAGGLRRTVDGRRSKRVVLVHRNRERRSRRPPTRRRRRSARRRAAAAAETRSQRARRVYVVASLRVRKRGAQVVAGHVQDDVGAVAAHDRATPGRGRRRRRVVRRALRPQLRFDRSPALRSSMATTSAPRLDELVDDVAADEARAPGEDDTRLPARSSRERLVDAAPAEDRRQRVNQQPDVLPERPVRHVEVVELHHLLERDRRPAEHLPEAGDPRREVEPAPPPAGDVLVDVGAASAAARRGSCRRAARSRAAEARRGSCAAGSGRRGVMRGSCSSRSQTGCALSSASSCPSLSASATIVRNLRSGSAGRPAPIRSWR